MNNHLYSSWDSDRFAAMSCKKTTRAPRIRSERFTMVGSALDLDVIELKKQLAISYDMALRLLEHRADKWDIVDFRKALSDRLASGVDRKSLDMLRALVERYSLIASKKGGAL